MESVGSNLRGQAQILRLYMGAGIAELAQFGNEVALINRMQVLLGRLTIYLSINRPLHPGLGSQYLFQ